MQTALPLYPMGTDHAVRQTLDMHEIDTPIIARVLHPHNGSRYIMTFK